MEAFVSRQSYYYTGEEAVEVAIGGADYSSPNALGGAFDGELTTFDSVVEAVEAAIAIRENWEKRSRTEKALKVGRFHLVYGDTADDLTNDEALEMAQGIDRNYS